MNTNNAFFDAIFFDDIDTVRQQLDNNPDLIDSLYDVDKETALMLAINLGMEHRVEIAQLLCERGANIDLQNIDGDTALMLAAQANDLGMVEMLCLQGANLDIENNNQVTALFIAESLNNDKIVELLTYTASKSSDPVLK